MSRSEMTRRRFTSMAVALVTLAPPRSWGTSAADPKVTPDRGSLEGPLSRDVLRALVGQELSLLLPNRPATLVLLRVEDAARPDGGQFSVVFQGAPDLELLDGTYRVTHMTAGTTDLHLRPKGRDDRFTYYEAAFNLLPENAVTGPPPIRQRRKLEQPLYTPGR
jgi:uncharacterized protein DUF6916